MPIVDITWFWMEDFTVHATASDLRTQAQEAMRKAGVSPLEKFGQAVYVIRTKKPFAIQYPNRYTPTIYIGEGRLISRLVRHQQWLESLQEEGHQFEFEVAFCLPRVKNNFNAYRDYEAYLLNQFQEKFGALPLRNKQRENTNYGHQYRHTESVIGPTKGVRYTWAIQPLKSNKFRDVFERTGRRV